MRVFLLVGTVVVVATLTSTAQQQREKAQFSQLSFVQVNFAQSLSPALSSLFEAERAFARASVEKGIRASFLEFFADEAIVFQPHPVKYKEAVKDRPAPPDPLAVTLNWEPIFSDISAAGDMGYNTGPYTLTDNTPEKRPPQHGFFFSVWKKQADGNWKVVLDVGIQTNEAYTGSRELKTSRVIQRKANPAEANVEAERAGLLTAERDFLKAAQTDGLVKAFSKYSAQDARLHRNGTQPILGEAEIVTFLAKTFFTPTWAPMFADVAQSGDLGYTYGSYESKESKPPNAITEKGYYARVWKRGANNKWFVVLDTSSPLPPEQK